DVRRSGAAGEGDLRAVTTAQPQGRRNPPRLRPALGRSLRSAGEGHLLAGAAALGRERRLPARPVREAHRGRLEGKSDLLARPDARPAPRAGPPGDHQPMIAAVALALALQGGLPDRVAAAPDGEVRLSYATRPGVCGNGRNTISFDCEDGWCGRHRMSFGRNDDDAGCPCEPGPARVALRKRGGQVTRLRVYVGGAWRSAADGVTDLGTVSALA